MCVCLFYSDCIITTYTFQVIVRSTYSDAAAAAITSVTSCQFPPCEANCTQLQRVIDRKLHARAHKCIRTQIQLITKIKLRKEVE